MNPVTAKFMESRHIKVVGNGRTGITRTLRAPSFFTDDTDYNRVMTEEVIVNEDMVVIEIPKRELNNLAILESEVFNTMGYYANARGLFDIMIEMKQREHTLRQSVTAVANAYAQYSIVLNLAQHGTV